MGGVVSKVKNAVGSVVHGVEHGVEAAAHAVAHVGGEVYHVAKEGAHVIVHDVAPIVSKVAGVVAPIVSQLGPEGAAIGGAISKVGNVAEMASKLNAAGTLASPEEMARGFENFARLLDGPGLLGGVPTRKFGSMRDMRLYAGGECAADKTRLGARHVPSAYSDGELAEAPQHKKRRAELAAGPPRADVGGLIPALAGHAVTKSRKFHSWEEALKQIVEEAREKTGRQYVPGTITTLDREGKLLGMHSW